MAMIVLLRELKEQWLISLVKVFKFNFLDSPNICTNSYLLAVCGDGFIAFPEDCDDNNTIDGDGCDSQCKVEHGFRCDCVRQFYTYAPKIFSNDFELTSIEGCFSHCNGMIDSKIQFFNFKLFAEMVYMCLLMKYVIFRFKLVVVLQNALPL